MNAEKTYTCAWTITAQDLVAMMKAYSPRDIAITALPSSGSGCSITSLGPNTIKLVNTRTRDE